MSSKEQREEFLTSRQELRWKLLNFAFKVHGPQWDPEDADALEKYINRLEALILAPSVPERSSRFYLIESHDENGVRWGVGFGSPNPELGSYVECASKEDTKRLIDLLKR